MSELSLKRKRVKAYVNALSELILLDNPTREAAIEIVKNSLSASGVEPFRGISKPVDIYEKELISLYVVGTRGLGIHEEYSDKFNKVFYVEKQYDDMLKIIETSDLSTLKDSLKQLLGKDINDSDIARVLRLLMTMYYLDFINSNYVVMMLKKVANAFPENTETIRRFVKFFIAIKISSDIASGLIRNKMKKDLTKQLISLDIGVSKAVPSDRYIQEIAKILFNIPREVISKVLK
ncbi:MAG: DUF2192 domain-containing protein [Sulfolobales archaeon]